MTFSSDPKHDKKESLPDENQSPSSEEASSNSKIDVVSNNVFVDTVKENYQLYLRKCYAYVKCTAIAEDAVQEGVLAAYLNLSSIRDKRALASWIYRIVIRKAIDLLHKKRRLTLLDDDAEELVSYTSDGLLEAPIWAERSEPEKEALKNEGLEKICKAVESLGDGHRIPLLLKDFEGFSIKEISEMLQISESNTKVRIHRARIKLKSELNGYFFPEYIKHLK